MKHYKLIFLALLSVGHTINAYSNEILKTPAQSVTGGKYLWNQEFNHKGSMRSCTSCHSADPTMAGKHIRTGKPIKAMATSTNPARFSDPKKVAKWFKRNCKWTIGRECSSQEKYDIEKYLSSI